MNLLGIDFGTTKTLTARWDERTQSARTIRLGRGSDAIPTTVYADKSGKLEFGDDADDMRALDAAGWKGRIKRDLGRGVAVVLNGHRYSVVDLVSAFLSYVLKRVEEEVFHGPVNGVVITVPALYGPGERQELLEAARKAGFQNVELIEEPIAAGLAFLHEKTGTDLGEQIFVFDWGGGTLDLALVNYKNGDLSLNHEWIGGDKSLGGEDIDDSIIEGVDNLCATDHGLIDDQDDHRRLQIRRNLKEGKELLSRRSEHTFRLGFKQPVEFKWSRDELESYTATTVNRALDCLREQLRKLATEGIHPRQVLLIGGASSMPVIKRRIEGEMGIKAITWEHFHTAVALGAASHTARIRSNSQTVDSDKRSRPPKVSKKYAKEVFVENKQEKNAAPERQDSKDTNDSDNKSLSPEVSEEFSQEVVSENQYEDVPSCGERLSTPVPITPLNSHEESGTHLVTYKTKDLTVWEWFSKTSRLPPFRHWQLEQIVFDGDDIRITMRNGANFHLKVGKFEITKSYICDLLWFDFGLLYHKIRIRSNRNGVSIFIIGCDEQFANSEWEDIKRRLGIISHVPPKNAQGFKPATSVHNDENDKSSHEKSPPETHKTLSNSQGNITKSCTDTVENEPDSELQALIAKRLEYAWREWWVILFAKYLSAISFLCCLILLGCFLSFAGATSKIGREADLAGMVISGIVAIVVFLWAKSLFKLWRHAKRLTFWLLIPSSIFMFGIIGWLPFLFMIGRKGAYLFSGEYKKIIAATPMVKIKIFRGPVVER